MTESLFMEGLLTESLHNAVEGITLNDLIAQIPDQLQSIWDEYWPLKSMSEYKAFAFIALILLLYNLIFVIIGKRTPTQIFARVAMVMYLLIVLASTVFVRQENTYHNYRFELFWSYKWGIQEYGLSMIKEIVLNVFLLMPYGFLRPAAKGKRCLITTVLKGMLFSMLIEFMQLVFKRGLCELDDIFHNTLGVLIGYIIWRVIHAIITPPEAKAARQGKRGRRADTRHRTGHYRA